MYQSEYRMYYFDWLIYNLHRVLLDASCVVICEHAKTNSYEPCGSNGFNKPYCSAGIPASSERPDGLFQEVE